jgi:retron-type reverse transcriptase
MGTEDSNVATVVAAAAALAEARSTAAAAAAAPLAWEAIAGSGGIHNWVERELNKRGLIESVDFSTLSAAEKKKFKERRDEERRVRRQLKAEAWQAYRRAHVVHVGIGVFYHDTADVDRYDIDDPEGRRDANAAPALADAGALAAALGLSIPRLRWLVYHREVETHSHYHFWTVPKRDGTPRLISAPKPDLKAAQAWIARHITERLPVHGACHGFLPGRSTASNAAVHAGASVVIKLDIRDFYPSIVLPRVKGLFRKAGYGEQVATLLALLCTEPPREVMIIRGQRRYVAVGPRAIPQGAPTSPSISNALPLAMDCRLAGLAASLGVRYTRYADDLTFSWHGAVEKAPISRLKHAVSRVVADEGFAIKEPKTRIMRAGRRQRITGLVVNGAPGAPAARVPRELVRKLRVLLHRRESGHATRESLEEIRGLAAYIYMCDRRRGRGFLDRVKKLDA